MTQQLDLNFLPNEDELAKQYEDKMLNLPTIQEENDLIEPENPLPQSLNFLENDLIEPETPLPQSYKFPENDGQPVMHQNQNETFESHINPYAEQMQANQPVNESLSSYAGSDLTPEEEENKKKQLLYKLKRFQRKGFSLSRVYNLDSNLIDIRSEFESIKREANLSASVETMKKGLSVGTYAIEMINTKFNPIGARLEGWSAQVKDDLHNGDFDEIFEDLYDKYTDSITMPPEMRLLSILATSALQYHIAQVIVNNTLTRDRSKEIIRENPKLKKDINLAVRKTFNNNKKNFNTKKQMKIPSDLGNIMEEMEMEDNSNDSTFNDDEKMDEAISLNF